MKKKLISSIVLLCISVCTTHLSAQTGEQWLDVTSAYLQNPNFDNDSKAGWTMEANSSSTNTSYGCQEFWNGTFNFYQVVNSLPNGTYRLSLNGYYRNGNYSNNERDNYRNGNHTVTAVIYANDTQQPMKSLYSDYLESRGYGNYQTYSTGGWGGWGGGTTEYYPDNMEAADYCFKQGLYQNSMEFSVTDGTLKLGVCNYDYIGGNWCIFDNFKLEYYGRLVQVSSIQLSSTNLSLVLGETAQLQATVLPSNATYQQVEWSSSNASVVSVDANGNLQALAVGAATITVAATDGSNVKSTCRVTVSKQDATSASLVINEIMSANVDMFIDPSFNYGGWVELYNPTGTAASVANFYVSDDPANLKKCRLPVDIGMIPAHGYLTLWFDNKTRYAPRQVDMKLDSENGGTIYISNSDGKLVAQQEYPVAITRTSYARKTDNGSAWGYTDAPTPNATNATSTFSTERLDAPVVDKDGQVFYGTLQIVVNIPSGATLRYTTDGSTPTLTNGSTSSTGIFNISNTTNYRFRLFQTGKLASSVVTRTYILDNGFTLPVISIVSDRANLYGDDYGIFVRGNGNGIVGNGQSSPCNWNTDWEHPANFEYFIDGQSVFNQEASVKSAGGWSRAYSPHSFKIKADKVYEGKKYLDYPFFDSKPYLRHKVLHIRNGGNDNNARFIDPSIQEIIQRSGIDVDGQSYQPVHHYINGSYIGVINMREPNNKHFALANWGIDTDEMDQFEMSPDSGYVQKAGDKEMFLQWYELAKSAYDEGVYEEIRNIVDVDEYINYMATELYLGGTDFPQNNVKAYRPRVENGRFRFVCFDLDFAFNTSDPFSNFFGKQYYTFDTLHDLTDAIAAGKTLVGGNRIYEEIELVTIFLNMLQNDTFRKQFVDSYCIVAGSVFEPTRCAEIVDELYNRVYDAMAKEWQQNSLTNSANTVRNGLTASRQNTLTQRLKDYDMYFHQGNIERQQARLSANIDEANILINDLPVPTNKFDGYLFAPITLRANAPAHYKFVGWRDMNASAVATTLFTHQSPWHYYDQGSLDGIDWTSSVNTSWQEGNAPLGYYNSDRDAERNYQTTLDYGGDVNNRYPTYYFTKNVTLSAAPAAADQFLMDWTADDGFVVYVNGVEATRYNMPSGSITFNTFASTYAHDNPDSGTSALPTSLFKKGDNVIAVEVHNNAANSTDIYWSAELRHLQAAEAGSIVSTDETYTMPSHGSQHLIAVYEPLTAAELAQTDSHPVKINEISASNSVYVNEYFKRNDWIELYNTTDHEIDVAGMYISDNLKKPQKFQILPPSLVEETYSTTIPPHGYLVIWADKLESLSQLHVDFKLDAEGGDVLLTAADESWCDTLSYIIHNGDQSVGLYPDGGSQLYVMSPTIGKSNRLNTYAVAFDEPKVEPEPDGIRDFQLTQNGGMSLAYTNGTLIVRSDDPTTVSATVYTPAGAQVLTAQTAVSSVGRIDVSTLPEGIYIARVRNADGDICQIKFIRK